MDYKRAYEELLKENNKLKEDKIFARDQFDLVMNATNDGFFDWDLVTNQIYYSPAWKRMIGYEDHELKNDFSIWEQLTDPNDVKRSWNMLNEHINGIRERFRIEFRMRHKNGEWVEILSRAKAIKDSEGKAVRVVGTHVDVTERKKAEEALRNEKEFMEIALSAQQDTFFLFNPKTGQAIRWNKSFREIVGYSDEEIAVLPAPQTYYDEADLERAKDFIQEVYKKGKGIIELELVCKNGSRIPTEYNVSVVRNKQGEIEYFISIGRDISERRSMEDALRLSESKLREVSGQIPGAIYQVCADAENNITMPFISEGAPALFGFPVNSSLVFNDLIKFIHPDDLDRFFDSIFDSKRKLAQWDCAFRIIWKKDKTVHWIRGRSIPHQDDDGRVIWNGVLLDITQQKKAEQLVLEEKVRTENILEGTNVGTWDWNLITGETFLDKRWAEIIGYTLEELQPITHKTLINSLHPDDRAKSDALLRKHFRGEIDYYDIIFRQIHKNGSFVWVNSRGKVVEWTQDGKPLRMSGTHLDITTRKLAEENLKRSEEKYRLLFENMTVGFALHEIICNDKGKPVDYRYLEINPAFEKLTGLNVETTLGKTIREVMPEVEDYWIDTYGKVALTGEAINYENYVRELDRYYSVFSFSPKNNQFAVMFNDITDQKIAQQAIMASEQQLQLIFDNSPAIMMLLDENTRVLRMNKTGLQFANTTLEEVINKQGGDVFRCIYALQNPEGCGHSLECEQCALRNTVRQTIYHNQPKNRVEAELTISRKKGRTNKLFVLVSSVQAKSPPDPTYLVTIDDITERRISDQLLEESYIKYKTLAQYTYDWEYWKGPDEKYIYISPSCERITGYAPSEFETNHHLFHNIIFKDDRKIWSDHEEKSKNQVVCKNPIEFRIETKTGKIKWLNHVCQPVYGTHGEFIGNRGTNRDITVQKLSQLALTDSELRFKQLADLAFEGIFIHKEGIAKDVNVALCNMSEYAESELVGINILDLLVAKESIETLTMNMRNDKNEPFEIMMVRKTGDKFSAEITTKWISKKHGLRVASVRDISERKQVQQKILNTIIQTEEQERKRLAQELHDGLGPVLSTIKLYTQTYIDSDNEEFKYKIESQLLSGIDEALEQVSAISNNLSPHILNDFGLHVAIQKFIDKIKKVTHLRIMYKNSYDKKLNTDVEITLYRVVIELLNNSIKHAKAGQIEIEIGALDDNVLLVFTDDGIGFDVKKLRTLKRGMGLFNIENRVKSLGGKVQLSSKNNAGTKYRIQIPN